jgi:hypothetical protein
MVRLLTCLLLAVLGAVLAAGLVGMGGPTPAPRAALSSAPDRTQPLVVLREWDTARADAWRQSAPAALRDLYVEGSAAGRADRALLAAYRSRGLRVVAMTMQRAGVRVVAASGSRFVLEVTDRLVGSAVRRDGARLRLPRDDWSTRLVRLVRVGERWRVARVRDQTS